MFDFFAEEILVAQLYISITQVKNMHENDLSLNDNKHIIEEFLQLTNHQQMGKDSSYRTLTCFKKKKCARTDERTP
jgi:hypothetical protein